jgi:transposase
VVDQDGFPVFSKIYSGNIGEPKTLQEILTEIYPESTPVLFPELRPTIVMDRGIATKDNIQLLKDEKFPYAIVERRAVQKDYVEEFTDAKQTFDKVEKEDKDDAPVYIRKIPIDEGSRVLCLSERREYKERSIDTKKESRFLEDIARLLRSVKKGSIKISEKVNQRIGRLRERYRSIASLYEITIETDESKKHVKNICWQKTDSRKKKEQLYGCYVIETSHEDLSGSEIWSLYTTLTRVENAFRALKSDLGSRPIYHQGSTRTEAHLFISVLAYHLLVSIEYSLRKKGDHRTWSTIREQLSTHQRTTVILLDD